MSWIWKCQACRFEMARARKSAVATPPEETQENGLCGHDGETGLYNKPKFIDFTKRRDVNTTLPRTRSRRLSLDPSCRVLQVKRSSPLQKATAPVTDAKFADNACIYQDFVPVLELVHYPYIHQVWPSRLQTCLTVYPKYLQWGLACVALNHRINRLETQDASHCKALARKFYEYRAIAI